MTNCWLAAVFSVVAAANLVLATTNANLFNGLDDGGSIQRQPRVGRPTTTKVVEATKGKKGGQGKKCPKNVHPFSIEKLKASSWHFNRINTFPVCKLIDPNCNTDATITSESIAVTSDGQTILFIDGGARRVGVVDIRIPLNPQGRGFIDLAEGFPNAVRVKGNRYVLVTVDTSRVFKGGIGVTPQGFLAIIDLQAQPPSVIREIDLGGQPDSLAISPDQNYVAVAIENRRDEGSQVEQLPAGFVVVIDTDNDDPQQWTFQRVVLTGLPGVTRFPNDPEPEYVDFNNRNEIVVSLQESNALVVIDATTKTVKTSFTAGALDLQNIDVDNNGVINQCDALQGVVREPDAVAWASDDQYFTADEGDLFGGSRTVTLFDKNTGNVIYSTGPLLEHIASAYGHYPESRSENGGNSPGIVAVEVFGTEKYLFTLSEGSSLVYVFELDQNNYPRFVQALPSSFQPEGFAAIPERNLLVISGEADDRARLFRSSLTIYEYIRKPPAYPTIISASTTCDGNGATIPIPFGALSGLAHDPDCDDVLYSVQDRFYSVTRFFKIDTSQKPAVLYEATMIMDTTDVLGDYVTGCGSECFLLNNPVNPDGSVKIDAEGIAVFDSGDILVVSEGDTRTEKRAPNFVVGLNQDGEITAVWTLPPEWNDKAKRWGFQGVAINSDQKMVVVANQVAWGPCNESPIRNTSPTGCTGDDPHPALHIFLNGVWSGFVYYPLDVPTSQYTGGWVGIGDISPLGNKKFAVLEHDNRAGPDAAIKRIYTIDLNGWASGRTVMKMLLRDILNDIAASTSRAIPEKFEGLACQSKGCWVINDNDGVEDNSGENQLLFVSNKL